MRTSDTFVIDSDHSGHCLSLNGHHVAKFTTLDAAEAEAGKIAGATIPGASLQFGLDFMSTLTDLQTRAAVLRRDSGPPTRH